MTEVTRFLASRSESSTSGNFFPHPPRPHPPPAPWAVLGWLRCPPAPKHENHPGGAREFLAGNKPLSGLRERGRGLGQTLHDDCDPLCGRAASEHWQQLLLVTPPSLPLKRRPPMVHLNETSRNGSDLSEVLVTAAAPSSLSCSSPNPFIHYPAILYLPAPTTIPSLLISNDDQPSLRITARLSGLVLGTGESKVSKTQSLSSRNLHISYGKRKRQSCLLSASHG